MANVELPSFNICRFPRFWVWVAFRFGNSNRPLAGEDCEASEQDSATEHGIQGTYAYRDTRMGEQWLGIVIKPIYIVVIPTDTRLVTKYRKNNFLRTLHP